jgi:iron complex transport system substrate-binding protein
MSTVAPRRPSATARALAAVALVAAVAGTARAQAVSAIDDAGRRVNLAAPAQRVAALAPNLVEQLYAIGAGQRIVATSEHADHPEAARRVPRVAVAGSIDLERLVAAKPDLVVVWGGGTSQAQQAALARLGLPVYVAEAATLDAVASSMERLGVLTAAPDAAAAAARYRADLATLRQRHAGTAPVRVFYQAWPAPLITLGGRHVISEAIALCGGRNVFAALEPLAPTVSPEAVLAADPQLIVAAEPHARPTGALEAWRRYPQLNAVRSGALVTLDADRLTRAGPRLPGEVGRLCTAIAAARPVP